MADRFTADTLARIYKDKIIGVRAGSNSAHRVIGIWAVVVEQRVFVRSWSMKPHNWWRTAVEDPYGSLFVGKAEFPVRTVQTRSARLMYLVSAAHEENRTRRALSSM